MNYLQLSDSKAAKALLNQLQAPESTIDQINESVRYEGSEICRDVEVHLNASEDGDAYFQPLGPKRGQIVDIAVADPSSIMQVPHHEHLRVSQLMVLFRFLSVWTSARAPQQKKRRKRFDAAMLRVLRRLQEIPALSDPVIAVTRLNEEFWDDGSLVAIRDTFPDVDFDNDSLKGLNSLCTFLANRYTLLLKSRREAPLDRKAVTDSSQRRFTYTYYQDVSDTPDGTMARRGRFRRMHGLPARTLRMHLPLAKRTQHYSVCVEVPDGYFVSNVSVLKEVASATDQTPPVVCELAEVEHSLSISQSRRALAFISSATGIAERLYLSINVHERPDRSILGAIAYLPLVLLAMVATLVLELTSAPQSGADIPALLVALLALGGAAAQTMSSGGSPLGLALAPRYAMYGSALIAVMFALIIAYGDLEYVTWARVSAMVLCGFVGVIFILLVARFRRVMRTFWRSQEAESRLRFVSKAAM